MMFEQALLGQVLLDNDVFFRILPQDWWFIDSKNRAVFGRIKALIEDGATADILSVGTQDAGYVASLTDIPTTANAEYYAKMCRAAGEKEELRKLSLIIQDSIKTEEPDNTLEKIDSTLDKLSLAEDYKIMKSGELIKSVIEHIEERFKAEGKIPGIRCGFEKLDDMILGFQPERMYVLGARPSQGKSALMLNFINNISEPVGLLTLESGYKEVLIREISSMAQINSANLASGYLTSATFSKITDVAGKLYEKPFYIYDKPNCSLVEIIGQCRRMVKRHGVKIIFIDYLQLIQVKAETERERVQRVSNRVKDLSRELSIPIVSLAQLRRDTDGRMPSLGDFQHSSQIEQDADVGMLIYQRITDSNGRAVSRQMPEEGDDSKIFLLIAKNRDGQTGRIELDFQKETVTFKERR